MGSPDYKNGDGVGIGLLNGYLVYKVIGGNRYLSTRTKLYPIPSQITSRDQIRQWALDQYNSGQINPPLYPGPAIIRDARGLASFFVKGSSNKKEVNYLHGDGVGVPGGNLLYKVDPATGHRSLCSRTYCWLIPSDLKSRDQIRTFGAKLLESVPIPPSDLYPGSPPIISGIRKVIDFFGGGASKKETPPTQATSPPIPQKKPRSVPPEKPIPPTKKNPGTNNSAKKPPESYGPGQGIDVGPGVVVFDTKNGNDYVRTRHAWYPIPSEVPRTKEAIKKWATDAFLSGAFGNGGALYDPIGGKTKEQQKAEELEKNTHVTNTKLVPFHSEDATVLYQENKIPERYLEAKLLERQQLFIGPKGYEWKKTGYVISSIRLLQKQAPNSNQTPELDGSYVVASVSSKTLLKNPQGIPYKDLNEARNRAHQLLQWGAFSTKRDGSVKNYAAGLVGAVNNNFLSGVSQAGVKFQIWASSLGQAPDKVYSEIDRYFEEGKKEFAGKLGVDPGTQAYQRSEQVGDLIILLASLFNIAKLAFSAVKVGPSIVAGVKNINTLASMMKNPRATIDFAHIVMSMPYLYKALSPQLQSLVQMGLVQSKNPRAAQALSIIWKGRKVALPVAFALTKACAYMANYFANPKNIKSTWQESVNGLLHSPGFHIAILTGLVQGGLVQYAAGLRLKAGASMDDILKIGVLDAYYWSLLTAISNGIVRSYDGEKIITQDGILKMIPEILNPKTISAALNGAADGSFTGFLPGAFVPFKSSVFEVNTLGKLTATSYRGFKDPALWTQSMLRFGLGASVDGSNQWASADGDFKKINMANVAISGMQSALYPLFMAAFHRLTMINYSSLSKMMPSIFSTKVISNSSRGAVLEVTSTICDTMLSNVSYGSRYLTYGVLLTFLKRYFKNNNILTVEDIKKRLNPAVIDNLVAEADAVLKSQVKLQQIIKNPEFKKSMQHIDSLPPVMQLIALDAYEPSPEASKAIKNLISSDNGLKKLAQIPIPPYLTGNQINGIMDNMLIQASALPKVSGKNTSDAQKTNKNLSQALAFNSMYLIENKKSSALGPYIFNASQASIKKSNSSELAFS